MTVLTEGVHKGECLVSEEPGWRSRDKAVLLSGQSVVDGQILTLSGGKYQAAEGDESDATLAVSYGNWDADGADLDIVVIKRDAVVKKSTLSVTGSEGNLDDAIAGLATLGIIARETSDDLA
jgi:hypothetical protein